MIRWKCKLRQLIGLVFPEYEDIYKDEKLFTENALNFIKTYPHADIIASKRIDTLMNTLASLYRYKPEHYRTKAMLIKETAKKACLPFQRIQLLLIR